MKKIYFLMLAMFTAIAANAWTVKFTNPDGWDKVAVWAWGENNQNFTGGNWPGAAMTKDGDVWTYTGEGNPTNLLFNNNNNGSQTKNFVFVDGATYNNKGFVGIVYAIHGQIFGNSAWDSYYMTEENGIWYYTGVAVTGDFGIKQETDGEQTAWYYSPIGQNEVNKYGTYPTVTQDGINFSNKLTGGLKFAFNPNNGELTISKAEASIDYTKWYLNVPGDFNDWIDNGVQFNADGKATITDLSIGTGSFKLKIWNGSVVWLSNGTAVEPNTPIHLTGDTGNMTIAGAEANKGYNVTFDAVTNMMTVTPTVSTGLETIAVDENAPVEYFNLQGIRVSEPVKGGLYIRRQGNTATKVLVK